MPYQSSRNLSRLLLQSGEARANAELRRGDIWAGAIQNIGNIAGRTLSGLLEERAQAPAREAAAQSAARRAELEEINLGQARRGVGEQQQMDAALQHPGGRAATLKSLEAQPELYKKAQTHFAAIDENMNRLLGSVAAGIADFGYDQIAAVSAIDDLIEKGFDDRRLGQLKSQITQQPQAIQAITDRLLSQSPDPTHRALVKAPVEPKLHNVAPGTSVIDANNPAAGPVFTAPPNTPQAQPFNLSPGQTRFGPDGQPVASLPAAAPAPQRDTEPLVPVIGDDGQPVLLPRSQAAGRRPASTREQGRPVTSGDANRIAELDTSLNDLATLADTLSETAKATGTVAKAGAMLWNPITELTGWGEDAKKRQGVIDRVKQVIGKALEGGVLRKEDEYKYTKILPTIGDTQAVATSKLAGLQKALVLRRQTTLEALADAGYDTSKFGDTTNSATVGGGGGRIYYDADGNPVTR